MKVFLATSVQSKKAQHEIHQYIMRELQNDGCEIIGLEAQDYDYLLSPSFIESHNHNDVHYAYTQKAIDKANAVIIEASEDAFQSGYEATLALSMNKPVLVLSNNKNHSLQIRDPKFYGVQYKSKLDIANAIKKFLSDVKKKHRMQRFNAMLSPEHRNYLEWKAKKLNTSVSDIFRDLIEKDRKENPQFSDQD